MGPDFVPSGNNHPAVVVIPSSKYVTGMTAHEAYRAGGFVVCGTLGDDHRRDIVRIASERGLAVTIVSADETLEPLAKEVVMDRLMRLRNEHPKDFVIECLPEPTIAMGKRQERPAWMGKKPWWQR